MPDTNPSSLPEPSTTTRSKSRATASDSSGQTGSHETGRKVHLVLQGKGGVGKTLIASLLAQYYLEKAQPVICLDADSVNASLSGLKALNARHVHLSNGDRVNVEALDQLVEQVLTEDSNFVVDAGASSFVPLSRYLVENGIADLIAERGKTVAVHTIVTGGPGLVDTLRGVEAVIEQFPPSVQLVTWLNEYFGQIGDRSGKGFEGTPLYQEHKHRLAALVHLSQLNPDTFGADLSRMLARRMTFAEALDSPDFYVVAKSRLSRIRAAIWPQLAMVA